MTSKVARAAGLGSLVTVLIFLTPGYYEYAPVVGGLVAGFVAGDGVDGARSGARIGVAMLPGGIALVVLSMLAGSVETGIDVLVASLHMGPQNLVFYGTLVFFLVVLMGLAGLIFGWVAGVVVEVVRSRTLPSSVKRLLGTNTSATATTPLPVTGAADQPPSFRQVVVRSVALAATSVVLLVTYWWYQDFRLRLIGDAGAAINKCDALLADPVAWFTSHQLLYSGFQLPFCAVLGVGGVRTWFAVQVLGWALVVVLMYRTGAHLFGERGGFVAGVATLLLWETFRFAFRAQSDLALLVAVAIAFWSLARYERSPSRERLAVAAGALLLVTVTRPLGFPLVFGWVVWKLLDRGETSFFDPRSLSMPALALLVVFGTLAIMTVANYFLPNLTVAEADPSLSWRRGFVAAWANGLVVTHPGTPTFSYLYTPQSASSLAAWMLFNADHLLVLALFRSAFFFVPVLPRWSTVHIITNAVTIFPLVLGTFAATRRLLVRHRYDLIGLLVAPIVTSLVTVSIIYLDGGFNYRAPATLSFALLTAYWIDAVATEYDVTERLERWRPVTPSRS